MNNNTAISTGLCITIMLGVPVSMLNIMSVVFSEVPTTSQTTISYIFCLFLIMIATIVSAKTKGYEVAASCLWAVGALLMTIGYYGEYLSLFFIVIIVFAVPLYGLNISPHMVVDYTLLLLLFGIGYLMTMIGCMIGNYIRRRDPMKG